MKKTGKIFGIIALAALVLFMAACATSKPGSTSTPGSTSAPSGTYRYTEFPSLTVTFTPGYFTFFYPASMSPTGKDQIMDGKFTVSGKTVILTGLDQPVTFIIIDDKTLTDNDDGSVWKKQ